MTEDGGMDEVGMVYPDDVDEVGWPDDPRTDERFLMCDGHVKQLALTHLWQPFGAAHALAFEELDIEDVPAAHLPSLHHAVVTLLDEPLAPELCEYLARLECFIGSLVRQHRGMTVSL